VFWFGAITTVAGVGGYADAVAYPRDARFVTEATLDVNGGELMR